MSDVPAVTTTWCAVIPQKALSSAKGRVDLPPAQRHALATSMLRDTVAAVSATVGIEHVFVAWDDRTDASALDGFPPVRPVFTVGRPLNDALELAAARARLEVPGAGLVVVPSDLPALDPHELDTFLARAGRHDRAFVADADADGTSVLSATSGSPLRALYGPDSRHRHLASGARELTEHDLTSLRHDVDDLAMLEVALGFGRGTHTLRLAMDGATALPLPDRPEL